MIAVKVILAVVAFFAIAASAAVTTWILLTLGAPVWVWVLWVGSCLAALVVQFLGELLKD